MADRWRQARRAAGELKIHTLDATAADHSLLPHVAELARHFQSHLLLIHVAETKDEIKTADERFSDHAPLIMDYAWDL